MIVATASMKSQRKTIRLVYLIERITIAGPVGQIHLARTKLGPDSCYMDIHCSVKNVRGILPQLGNKVISREYLTRIGSKKTQYFEFFLGELNWLVFHKYSLFLNVDLNLSYLNYVAEAASVRLMTAVTLAITS